MTYEDFFTILEDTGCMIISKELFHTLLESQMPGKLTAVEKKKIYDDGYKLGYAHGMVDSYNESEGKDADSETF